MAHTAFPCHFGFNQDFRQTILSCFHILQSLVAISLRIRSTLRETRANLVQDFLSHMANSSASYVGWVVDEEH